jgi:glucuronate isomerase
MSFISDDFLLHNQTARRLFHTYAAEQPILDYHSHLPPRDIAENRQFQNLFEIWLEGDHYKWRAMRANGIDERYITGDASPYEKFLAWARTVPATLRNPLYHWTHLELKRYFGIGELLNESSAKQIWDAANAQLRSGDLNIQQILRKFRVTVECTTDDPIDSLEHHAQIAARPFGTQVFPTFRPDAILRTHDSAAFNSYVDRLAETANAHIANLSDLLAALDRRHEFFHQLGCRLSDHGLETCYADFPSDSEAIAIFAELRAGRAISPADSDRWASHLMLYFGHLDTKRNWTKQLHLGALRNNNPKMLVQLGRDTGFDSMGDWPQAEKLSRYLGRLAEENALPRIILYNNNPADNYVFATMIGNFQGSTCAGKVQFGSGWWFLDQKDGIELQLNALSNAGLLSRFVGMLTDSRSFMSFPRHEYFRRVLCNLLGREMENGELPNDEALIGSMISDICYNNAARYFGFSAPATAPAQSGAQ